MTTPPDSSLGHKLRQATSRELVALLREFQGELDLASARQALRNPFLTTEAVDLLMEVPGLLTSYEFQRELVAHPRVSIHGALRFVPGLYWRDLVRVGSDTRIHPRVRRAADIQLAHRLPGLAVGERMAIARRAGTTVLNRLRHDPDPRVMEALLENPRLTEGQLAPVVSSPATRPSVLALIARNRRWGRRYALKVGLCRNPTTPVPTALELVATLKKVDLRAVASDLRLAPALRRRAELLLGLR